jgi:type IV secretion system protein VirD4
MATQARSPTATAVVASATLAMVVAVWTALASYVFLLGTGLLPRFHQPETFWQWWVYLPYASANAVVGFWLKASGGGAAAAMVALVVLWLVRRPAGPPVRRSLLGALFDRQRGGPEKPTRGASDNHGHADWLAIRVARQIYPGPNPAYGGVVVGEAYRVDEDVVAGVMFDPKNKATWGQGGKAPLLIDPCDQGPTHSLLFAGAGSFKSTSAVTTLLTWTGSAVVLDPSCELGPMLTRAREAMGQHVYQLDLKRAGACGFNVLDWIDIASPMAETNIRSVTGWLSGEAVGEGQDKNSEFFSKRGRALIACLLAHMLWDDELPPELKTLATLRRGLATPEEEMRELLGRIHCNSKSAFARDHAGALKGIVDDTFSGIYSNADEDTSWLANPAFAKLVSGSSFRCRDLTLGNTTVFLQIPLAALDTTPGLARVVIGALLNAAYEADGDVEGRILYLLDEVYRVGPMAILETARDAGRKYGITLQLLYQSVGQLIKQWGKEGKRAWYDGVSWRGYAAIQDLETAKELSEEFGTYGVVASSEGANTGSSGKGLEPGSRSRGKSTNTHEIVRPLIRPDELMSDCRTDELFVVPRGARPLRCGRAIFFRRAELVPLVDANRFAKPGGRKAA